MFSFKINSWFRSLTGLYLWICDSGEGELALLVVSEDRDLGFVARFDRHRFFRKAGVVEAK